MLDIGAFSTAISFQTRISRNLQTADIPLFVIFGRLLFREPSSSEKSQRLALLFSNS